MSANAIVRAVACAGAITALAALPASAGPRGWINQAIESQKAQAPPVPKPAVKSQSTAQGSGGRAGDDKPPPKTGGGGYQISSSTGGGGMDEMALVGTGGAASRSVEAGRAAASER